MPNNRYYYYDEESCSFVEVPTQRTKTYGHLAAMLLGAVALAWALTWGLDHTIGTPQELALQAENEALQQQLAQAGEHMERFEARLNELSSSDQQLYRTLLDANPISPNVRQAGVGGSDPYEKYDRFSKSTAKLLRQTSQQIDQLQRRINLQNTSYRDLLDLAKEREKWLVQMPALLPTDGPLVSGFGKRMHPILGVRKMHTGIDMVVDPGTPVVATGNGVVKQATFSPTYGNFVELKHPKTNYTSLYAHLSKIPDHIKPGVEVKRAETIGFSGNTGRSTGPHLHYEVRKNDRPLDPVRFFVPSMTPEKYEELRQKAEQSTASLD